MNLLSAFFRLIRWQNLVVIILSQSFIQYLIIKILANSIDLPFSNFQFLILVLSTILIAAAGNILNDLADFQIDKLNKPEKTLIETTLSAKTASIIAWIFNAIGLLLAVILAYLVNMIQLALIQLIVILLLQKYTTTFKKQLLVGNLIVALLTALSVFIVYLYNLVAIIDQPILLSDMQKQLVFILKLTLVYTSFAFISNFIREIIKDIEDINGDKVFGLQTFPIVYGIKKATILARIINSVLLLAVLAFIFYSFKMNWYFFTIYSITALIIPIVYFEFSARKAIAKKDFHHLSSLSKIIMLAGILSMQILSLQF